MFGIFKSAPTLYDAHYAAVPDIQERTGGSRADALFDKLEIINENSGSLEIKAKTDTMARNRARHAIDFKSKELNIPLKFVALYKISKKNGQWRNEEISI